MNEKLKFLINLVEEASKIITDEFVVKSKDDKGDLVTNFDYEIENFIISKIKQNYPKFDIVSEENNSQNELSKNCFVIDPLDGTINFAHRLPLWGIQVACIENGETCAAVIFLPKFNEIYYADKSGAFKNGEKIHVNNLQPDKCLYTIEGPNRLPSIVRMVKNVSPNFRNTFCSAINFAWVASGVLGGTIFKKDSYWDYIPGQYIVKQAGGYIFNSRGGGGTHIAANSPQFVEILKENAGFRENDKI